MRNSTCTDMGGMYAYLAGMMLGWVHDDRRGSEQRKSRNWTALTFSRYQGPERCETMSGLLKPSASLFTYLLCVF